MSFKCSSAAALTVAALLTVSLAHAELSKPTKGQDTIIDRIESAGVLKVAAIGEYPWLPENTSGSGEPFSGPAWIYAKEIAKNLGVNLEIVAVSHETKVPILATGQADITIAPLAITPARAKVVDFVSYSQSSLCMFGLSDNAKLSSAQTVDDLDKSDITIAYFIGMQSETWIPERFKKAVKRGVAGSGANSPVEEILSGRADIAPVDNVAWPKLKREVPGLESWPKGDACLVSREMAAPVAIAVAKGHPVFLKFLADVRDSVADKLRAEEMRIMKEE
ncbi:ABC transporter substrate-binding protein [Agrobacterium sp. LAD9]|uniref:substrate-binding periplasmic protein n=1 Tax=Agrobacterium sp. LAD9 TaxID=2055153 RepID=UPI000D1EE705|nr:transporter substrate-binding domain-containing protein [Agrobacterium sp. LAD9]